MLSAQTPSSGNAASRGLIAEGNRLMASSPGAAASAFRRAAQADSLYPDAWLGLAGAYQVQQKHDSAIYAYRRLLRIAPRHLIARQQLAAAYQMNNDPDASIQEYKELLKYQPGYPHAHYGMGLVYFSQEDYPNAIIQSETAMRIFLEGGSPDLAADARMVAAQGYLQEGNYDRALQYLKASRKHYEGRPIYHYLTGLCYKQLGDKSKATESLRIADQMGYKLPPYLKEWIAQ
jgi:anaphase-promoting complex subunit 3